MTRRRAKAEFGATRDYVAELPPACPFLCLQKKQYLPTQPQLRVESLHGKNLANTYLQIERGKTYLLHTHQQQYNLLHRSLAAHFSPLATPVTGWCFVFSKFPVILLFPTLPQSIGLGRLQQIRSSASMLVIQLRVLNHPPKSPPPLQTPPLVVFRLLFLTIPRLPELGVPSTAPKPVVTASVFLKLRSPIAAATSENAR